jgi:acyl dehydratase
VSIPQVLPTVRRPVTQDAIQRYADASGDYNPLHTDEVFGFSSPFGSTVAHGMWVMAALATMLTDGLGETWLRTGTLKVRLKGPARPGDEIVTHGELKSVRAGDEGGVAEYAVRCSNQDGEDLIVGTASAIISDSPGR